MTCSIGTFTFLALDGHPVPPRDECVVLTRPGVEGAAVWRSGARGTRFTLRSFVDAKDLEAARGLYAGYLAAIGGDPLELTWYDLKSTDEGYKVVVLDCRPAEIKAIIGGVGGLNPPSEGWCECDWDLIAVP